MNPQDNSFSGPILAITVGVGMGLLLAIGAQKLINTMERKECSNPPPNHVLVESTSFLGDTATCIDRRYTTPSHAKRN